MKENALLASWLLIAALAVGSIWLNTGVSGVQTALVSGYSMKPAFEFGDLVIVQMINPADVKVGDVIRYSRGVEVAHRVMQIHQANNGLVFITKGDNNNVEDEPVPEGLMNGKVVMIIPKIGWISIGVRQVFGWVH